MIGLYVYRRLVLAVLMVLWLFVDVFVRVVDRE